MLKLFGDSRMMILKIRHALLEISNHPNVKQSAIIINNGIIITSGHILKPYVRPIQPFVASGNESNVCAATKIVHAMQQCCLIDAQAETNTDEAELLNSLSFQISYDSHKLPPSDRRQAPILTRQRAHILYLFNSPEISRHLHTFLRTPCAEQISEDEQNSVLVSSFLVLSVHEGARSKRTFKRFLTAITHYIRHLQPLNALDDVLAMVSPFGMEHFFKSISIGKVSNVLGRDGALFLISNPLPAGCEGAAVFNNKLHLAGIIICTSFKWQQSNVNITLVANFGHVLLDFMRQLGITINSNTLQREPSSNFTWEKAMVVIETDGKQSTGTFIKIFQRKFILTCAHALTQVSGKVYCRNVDGEFESNVLWYNPQCNRPFDVALLAAPPKLPDRYCARLSVAKPSPGQMVFNAGFPCVLNFSLVYDFNPSIFQGRILKYGPRTIVSDGCVQFGQSGGPMFDQQGNVLGICITNMQMDQTVYPNVNTAVPICEIRSILENYAKTDDISVLDNLVADDLDTSSPMVMAMSKL